VIIGDEDAIQLGIFFWNYSSSGDQRHGFSLRIIVQVPIFFKSNEFCTIEFRKLSWPRKPENGD
jgi:hypothetical protein